MKTEIANLKKAIEATVTAANALTDVAWKAKARQVLTPLEHLTSNALLAQKHLATIEERLAPKAEAPAAVEPTSGKK